MAIIKFSNFFKHIILNKRKIFLICGILILIYFIELILFVQDNTSNRVNFYLKLNKNNKNIYLSYYPRNLLEKKKTILPLSNIPNSEIIECYEKDNFFIFETDKYGFNNANNTWDHNHLNILLGDEFVLGSCLNDKNFSSLLLQKQNTLNLSNRGTGPLTQLAIIKEFMPTEKTKNIFWFFNTQNDLTDLEIEKKDLILVKYLINSFSQNLVNDKFKSEKIKKIKLKVIKDEIDRNLKIHKNKLLKFIFIPMIRYEFRLFFHLRKNHNIDLKRNIQIDTYLNIINLINKISKKNNINLVIVFTPLNIYYSKLNTVYNNQKKFKVENFLREQKIDFINLENEIKNTNLIKEDIFFSSNARSTLNEKGHKFVFEIVNDKIKEINERN